MGARKDLCKTFSKLTKEEVDSFFEQWGIDPSINPVAPGCDKTVDQCPTGSIALYRRHFEFSNLRHPFSVFVLNVLEYYRVSFGQLHPQGVSRVLHFEVLCRTLCYDPNLLMFRRFFRLAKNGDWFTFETSQIDVSLISSLVTTLGSWKDRFFWVSESVVPFKMMWRHLDAVLNELESSESELNDGMLKALRACSSRLPMSALDFIKLDDTSDVGIEVEEKMELAVMTGKKGKLSSKKAIVSVVGGYSERSGKEPVEGNAEDVYVPNWQVKVGDNFKSSVVCEDVLNHFSPPMVRSSNSAMQDDVLISRMLLGVCNLSTILPEGVSRFCKRMHEYEEFSKKREKTKASMAAMRKEIEGFAEKEKSWVVKVHELTKRHEIKPSNEKKRMEADWLQLKADREALNVQQKAFLDEKEDLKASVTTNG
ncbi:hypothetical protein HanOQP8_Chr01g0026721 [Helianthus annuus]|nr:hypothetical protein HanOQP8_Chr01g0026721 [Helianthus annuus]